LTKGKKRYNKYCKGENNMIINKGPNDPPYYKDWDDFVRKFPQETDFICKEFDKLWAPLETMFLKYVSTIFLLCGLMKI
jgi:hypothetical protein